MKRRRYKSKIYRDTAYFKENLERWANWIIDYWDYVLEARSNRYLWGQDIYDLNEEVDWSEVDLEGWKGERMPSPAKEDKISQNLNINIPTRLQAAIDLEENRHWKIIRDRMKRMKDWERWD